MTDSSQPAEGAELSLRPQGRKSIGESVTERDLHPESKLLTRSHQKLWISLTVTPVKFISSVSVTSDSEGNLKWIFYYVGADDESAPMKQIKLNLLNP